MFFLGARPHVTCWVLFRSTELRTVQSFTPTSLVCFRLDLRLLAAFSDILAHLSPLSMIGLPGWFSCKDVKNVINRTWALIWSIGVKEGKESVYAHWRYSPIIVGPLIVVV
ncbi:hypothetical protein SAY87_023919 [Trapa incisa]|uniref:Uncharacterized protein n=1 Tax=Trapa incisa TaxID=236973 RepID=A0AAN7L498_9MYRT|nr:hypothetical protein SAY87_023919 [Trapa incisa]